MELEDLIELYINNPSEELKEIIKKVSSKASRINLIVLLFRLNKIIESNDENKREYNEIRMILFKEIKNENGKNYYIDETGRPIEINPNKEIKIQKLR